MFALRPLDELIRSITERFRLDLQLLWSPLAYRFACLCFDHERRLAELRAGQTHATTYQHWVRDVFTLLFGDVLKEPKLESKTSFGTLRRDVTYRNAAEKGPWSDWKTQRSWHAE